MPELVVEGLPGDPPCRTRAAVADYGFYHVAPLQPCASFATDGLWLESFQVRTQAGNVPVVRLRSRARAASPPRSLFVWLVGGPGDDVRPTPRGTALPAMRQLLAEGGDIIMPFYLGTRARYHFPEYPMDAAVVELDGLIDGLGRAYPDANIIVVGESAGGYLASRIRSRAVDALVLIAPPIDRPSALIDRFERLIPPLNRAVESSRVTLVNQNGLRPMINRFALIADFFASSGDRSLGENLHQSSARCTALLYGTGDIIIGIEGIAALAAALPELKVIAVPGAPHTPEYESPAARAFNARLLPALRDPCPARGVAAG